MIPSTVFRFTPDWHGPTRDEIFERMSDGDPRIFLHTLGNPDELAIDPMNIDEQELKIVINRLVEELGRS